MDMGLVTVHYYVYFFILFFAFYFCFSERVESGGRKGRSTLGCVCVRKMLKDVTYKNIYFSFGRERKRVYLKMLILQ